jgi:predicted alpha/beta hydrolase family esterase
MIRTASARRMTSPWPGSWPTAWPYGSSRIRLLEGYEASLRRRAGYVARRAEWLRRSAPVQSSPRPERTLELDVPDARSRHVDLPRGGRLFVHELAGPPAAPTVILLHGWRGTAAGNWATAMPTLARHFRVIAPDLRGHDVASVDDVVGLADVLGVERFIAVGYSLGSAVAAQVARLHPDRVQAIVLCAAAGVSVPPAVTDAGAEVPAAVVVTRYDRIVPAWRQLELARSLPGASVHSVEGNHLAFSRYDVFVPVLLDACQTVARRVDNQQTIL